MQRISYLVFNLGLAVCIGAGLYFRGVLLKIAFDYDELFTAVSTDPTLPFSWLYSHYLLVDVHPPLYNALMWYWNHWVPFGPEVWLRLPNLLLGVVVLWVAWYGFPRCLGKMARNAFVALLGCNIYLIVYAQNARSYTLVLLLSVVVTFLFLKLYRRMARKRQVSGIQWALFTGSAILLCWSHYFGALLAAICVLFLLVQALRTKTYIKPVAIVGCCIGGSFLPWLLPNFLEQIAFKRFSGNWWGNKNSWQFVPDTLVNIFATYSTAQWLLGGLVGLGIIYSGYRGKKTGKLPFVRELGVLLAMGGVALVVVALISLKTYLFFGRYFIAFLPCGYLVLVILWGPLLRRSVWAKVLFMAFLGSNLWAFAQGYKQLTHTPEIPTRLLSQIYRDFSPGKEIFVLAVEGFPPVSMPAMYGFYINRVYGLNVPVTELFSLDASAREEALKRKEQAFIWMPNCTVEKLQQVAEQWHRSFGIYGRLPHTCILKIFD